MKMVRMGVVCAALASLLLAGPASAEGLSRATAIRTVVSNVPLSRNQQLANHTSTPIPLRANVFMAPFAGADAGSAGLRYQAVDSTFSPLGSPVTIQAPGGDNCCAGIAENGGAKLGNNRSLVSVPIFTVEGAAGEVFGYSVASNGTPIDPGAAGSPNPFLTQEKPGNQGAPVIVPISNGTAFAMWSDRFHEAGESESSVRGRIVSADGETIGDEILIENIDSGAQTPVDGVQLKNGLLLLVFTASNPSDILGRVQFLGRLMRPNGELVGIPFRLGATNTSREMRVAALPNGNFVVTWVDDRVGLSVPVFRIFSPNGRALLPAQPFDTYASLGRRLDVAALSDSRFVIAGTLHPNSGSSFVAQLFSPVGQKVGEPLVLQRFNNPEAIREHHLANAGFLLGTAPPSGGIASASDPRRVYLVWRVNTPGLTYALRSVVLRADP
jgi:hypothetical protein